MKKLQSPEAISQAEVRSDNITTKSKLEAYWERIHWEFPQSDFLFEKHPLTKAPFWKEILRAVGKEVQDSDHLPDRMEDVEAGRVVEDPQSNSDNHCSGNSSEVGDSRELASASDTAQVRL